MWCESFLCRYSSTRVVPFSHHYWSRVGKSHRKRLLTLCMQGQSNQVHCLMSPRIHCYHLSWKSTCILPPRNLIISTLYSVLQSLTFYRKASLEIFKPWVVTVRAVFPPLQPAPSEFEGMCSFTLAALRCGHPCLDVAAAAILGKVPH